MKSVVALFVALVFVAITECADELPFSEADLEFFKNLKVEQLPRELKIALTKSARSGEKSSWCCRNPPRPHTIMRSRSVSKNIKVTTSVKTGYRKCNFWGKRCAKYEVRYSTKTTYSIGYYEVPDPQKCKEKDIVCCINFIQIAGNCLSYAEAIKNVKLLKHLKEIGALKPSA